MKLKSSSNPWFSGTKPRPLKVQWKWSPPHLRGHGSVGWWVPSRWLVGQPTWNAWSHEMGNACRTNPRASDHHETLQKIWCNKIDDGLIWTKLIIYIDYIHEKWHQLPSHVKLPCCCFVALRQASDFMSNPLEDARGSLLSRWTGGLSKNIFTFSLWSLRLRVPNLPLILEQRWKPSI